MRSVVVMSGGQDSTTSLGVAMRDSEVVLAVSYTYGQKHENEVKYAEKICELYDIEHMTVDLSPILKNMQSSALINKGDVNKPHPYLKNLPASFVPVRNTLFLATAYGLAMEIGAQQIYTGVCETDYSGYPDCRSVFVQLLNHALDVGYESKINIITPLMHLNKADTFKLAHELNMLSTVVNMTMTCYEGDTKLNDWGMGCGECPACKLRAKGWDEFQRYQARELV